MRNAGAIWWLAGAFAIPATIAGLSFRVMLNMDPQPIDLVQHIAYAKTLNGPGDIVSPHFLFQLIIRLGAALGIGYEAGTVLLMGVCYGAMGLMFALEAQRRGIGMRPWLALLLVPSLLFASHIFLPTAHEVRPYAGYFVPIVYVSTTQQLGKVFALAIIFVYGAWFLEKRQPKDDALIVLVVLCVLSALAKPSFLIVFMPAAGLRALLDLAKHRWQAVFGFCAIALPLMAVLFWQQRITYNEAKSTGIALDPFFVFDFQDTLWKLPLSLAFPLVVAGLAIRTRTFDSHLRFIWLFTAIALFYTLVLVETNEPNTGNFAWSGQTAVFLVYVESMLWLLSSKFRGHGWFLAWAVFAAHVYCGWIFSPLS
jgi:hypothetical protein